ncbi:MAG: hypothetical protein ACPHCJ_08220 [Oceanococcaceae bacterium]
MTFLNRAAAAVALCLSAGPLLAADMGGGTLTIHETELSFSNGPVIGVNPTNQGPDGEFCPDPQFSCDVFALTIDVPEDMTRYFPTAAFRVILTLEESPTGVDDFDLSLLDADGNIMSNSGNLPGEGESVAAQALNGLNEYTVRVVNWAVAGGTYKVAIDLSLGAPSDELTDEEIAAWFEENGGSSDSRDLLAACAAPGVQVLSDASGDGSTPIPGQDLRSLHVFQTTAEDGTERIGFQLEVDDLTQLMPQTTYFASFEAYGDVRGVRMVVDQEGLYRFESYVVGEDNDGEREGHFADSTRPAQADSNYTSDGLITIYTAPTDVLLFEPGNTLSGFNAGIISTVGMEGTGSLALNGDAMPDGLSRQGSFEFRSAQDCQQDAPSASGRDLQGALRGGANGGLLILLLSLLGLRRRA